MKEELLHFIWKYQFFNKPVLSDNNEIIEIIEPGLHNSNSGPDFLNAKIKIGNTTWAGNIEIHINASDWKLHKHHLDKNYQNVILHVVFNDNFKIEDKQRFNTPVVELSNYIDIDLLENYEHLMRSKLWVPCQNSVSKVSEFDKTLWVEKMTIERLEFRSYEILKIVEQNKNDWIESFYQYLSKSFGFKVNNQAFEQLSKSLPLKVITKHKNDLFQIEALLFGQSGLLSPYLEDEYPSKLLMEYNFLKSKYSLSPISETVWHFAPLRPANFPGIRIAQLASLLHNSNMLFSNLLEITDLKNIYNLFDIIASEYWQTHYSFDKFSTKKRKKLFGIQSINGIIINTVIPFLFTYALYHQKPKLKDRAVDFLYDMNEEQNGILTKWVNLGFKNLNAAQSQALLHLKKEYCNNYKCLNCQIGLKILSK